MRILRYPAMLAAVAYFGAAAAARSESVLAPREVASDVLRAGTGCAPGCWSAAQARLLARTAALADAYRNLAQVINSARHRQHYGRALLATDDTIRMMWRRISVAPWSLPRVMTRMALIG